MTTDEFIGARVHEMLWQQRIPQERIYTAMGLSRSTLAKKLRGQIMWSAADPAGRVMTVADETWQMAATYKQWSRSRTVPNVFPQWPVASDATVEVRRYFDLPPRGMGCGLID